MAAVVPSVVMTPCVASVYLKTKDPFPSAPPVVIVLRVSGCPLRPVNQVSVPVKVITPPVVQEAFAVKG